MCQQIRLRSDEKAPLTPVDLKMAIVKPLGIQWMINLYNYMTKRPDIIQNGFCKCGISKGVCELYTPILWLPECSYRICIVTMQHSALFLSSLLCLAFAYSFS